MSAVELGRYEGLWEKANKKCAFEIVIDETNFETHNESNKFGIQGFFEWRLLRDDEGDFPECIGLQAMEIIRGSYDPNTNILVCLGYKLMDDKHFLGHDGYAIDFNCIQNGKINTNTLGHELKWDNTMELTKVASKKELYNILMTNFVNEKGIVLLIADFIHYFKKPKTMSYNAASFNCKLAAMNKKYKQLLNGLFVDIEYSVTVANYQLDVHEFSKQSIPVKNNNKFNKILKTLSDSYEKRIVVIYAYDARILTHNAKYYKYSHISKQLWSKMIEYYDKKYKNLIFMHIDFTRDTTSIMNSLKIEYLPTVVVKVNDEIKVSSTGFDWFQSVTNCIKNHV
eukprot:397206_1